MEATRSIGELQNDVRNTNKGIEKYVRDLKEKKQFLTDLVTQ